MNITFKPTPPSRAGGGGYATFVRSHRVGADQERRRSNAAGTHELRQAANRQRQHRKNHAHA